MAVLNKRMTLDEFLALPEEEPALEYGEGVVTQKVSPKPIGRYSAGLSDDRLRDIRRSQGGLEP